MGSAGIVTAGRKEFSFLNPSLCPLHTLWSGFFVTSPHISHTKLLNTIEMSSPICYNAIQSRCPDLTVCRIFRKEAFFMKELFGFIGCGNMGSPLARAASKALSGDSIALSNRTASKAQTLARELDCLATDNDYIARQATTIFLGVKPQMMPDMLRAIAPILAQRNDRFVLVTMAAGLTIDRIRALAGGNYPVIRIMPNTPSSIGEGMILYTSDGVTDQELTRFLTVMDGAGRFDALPEHLIDAGSAVSGCGPAFVYPFIEALADGAVACGLPRAKAQEYAAQTLIGAAKLVLESGQHPAALKDAVCSPAGSTIAGVRALEEHGFRAAAMGAVIAAFERTKELGK